MSTAPTSVPEKIPAMVYNERGAQAVKGEYTVKPLGKKDADIIVTYNGICGSDKHMVDNDWGMSRYPLVPGHEVVGHVLSVGEDVKDLKVGDVVGLGAQCQACHDCNWCKEDRDNLCGDRRFTYMGNIKDEHGEHPHHGGFSSFIRTDYRHLFKVPASLEEKYVGPLMCGGLTVAAPLFEFSGPSLDLNGKKVGVIGLGGLGHMGVMFASKMGADTIGISRSEAKKSFAEELGATGYLDINNEEQVKASQGSFHYLLVCVSGGEFDVEKYVGLLRPYGVMHLVGVPNEKLNFDAKAFIFGRLTLSGSPIGSTSQMNAMLDFAAKNGIKPIIEEFSHSQCNEAMQKVRDNTIRFRAVLKNDLL